MTRASAIRIVEVGPRDGLQNEASVLPVADRIAFIEGLAAAGLKTIEAGSFVSPRHVPQMAGTASVLAGLDLPGAGLRGAGPQGVDLPVLVPNERGLEDALAAGAKRIAVFAAASETFSRHNINAGIAESLERYGAVVAAARARGAAVRGYVSCVLGCPYEGAVPHAAVIRVAVALADMGCDEISLGDTIGVGTPDLARALVAGVAAEIGIARTAVHFHDTFGQALANVLACLELGIAAVDASAAGLGGCPYAPGASGNLATEDLVYMLDGLGLATGVDLRRLSDAGLAVCRALGTVPRSRTALALAARAQPGGEMQRRTGAMEAS